MVALATIAAAINQIDAKKESLKKAFDDLQSHSSLLSPSFSLSWSDIDRHFSSHQASLSDRFRLLQSFLPYGEPSENVQSDPKAPGARPESRGLPNKMDAKRLKRYIMEHADDREAIKPELSAAMRCAVDPASMVLDAIESFNGQNGSLNKSIIKRRILVSILECLMEIDAKFTSDAVERAKKMASEWRKLISFDIRKASDALGFLHFVAAYGLGSEIQVDELVEFFFLISRYKQATSLCKKIGLGDKVTDIIRKLINSEKALLSIKYITEFELMDQFQLVPILKSYLKESKAAAQRVREEGGNSLRVQNEAIDKELGALKAVIKVIKEQKLESEFSLEDLGKHVEDLEKEKSNRRRSSNPSRHLRNGNSNISASKNKQQQQQRGKKRSRGGPSNGSKSAVIRPQAQPWPRLQPRSRPEGGFPDHMNHYGLTSTGHSGAVPYVGYAGNVLSANHQLHPPEANANPVYYSQTAGYGGYGLPPQYHPAYYPQ